MAIINSFIQASKPSKQASQLSEKETPNASKRLKKIKQLFDEGLITEAEAAEKRKAILDEF